MSAAGISYATEPLPLVHSYVCLLSADLVEILEHKVQRLSGEISDDVSEVTAPERGNTLLLRHANEHIDDTGVRLGDGLSLTLVLTQQEAEERDRHMTHTQC